MRTYAFAFLASLVFAASAQATTVHVPGDHSQIQAALLACSPGDTVLVAPGTYVENIAWPNTQDLCLISEAGPGSTTIDGGNPSHPDSGSVVIFSTGLDENTILKGFTLTNGTGTVDPPYPGSLGGGGIWCVGTSPTIALNVIIENTAQFGNGIECAYGSSPVITGNTIQDNYAVVGPYGETGGGIECCLDSSPTITGNTISGNVSGWGGGIRASSGHPTIADNDIIGNTATHNGGGIQTAFGSAPTITGNTITENWANYGAGISCWGPNPPGGAFRRSGDGRGQPEYERGERGLRSDPYIAGNSINANRAFPGEYGDGVMFASESGLPFSPTINSCSVLDNDGRGIVCGRNTTPIIERCIISNNDYGVRCVNGANPQVLYNDIFGNVLYGVSNASSWILVNAELNWWGDASGPYHPTTNPGGLGDRVSDDVDYDPWSTTSGVGEPTAQTLPPGLVLRQNHPNPFNPITIIEFSLPRRTHATLRVYNVLGQTVTTLVDDVRDAGTHRTSWDASGVASGMYFYRVEIDGSTSTRSMTLAR